MLNRTLTICTLALLVSSSIAAAQTLYGVSHAGPDGLSTFHTIDPNTGTATPVGPVGFERCGGMDFGPDGIMYAACERADGSDTPVLVMIDTDTGAGTEVGPTGITGAVADLSFRNSDGVLFAYDATNDPEHTIFIVDTMTGAASLVGDTTLSFASGNAMGFDLADTLFHSQNDGGAVNLNTIDQGTGMASLDGVLTVPVVPFPRLSGMDADPAGTFYGVLNGAAGGSGNRSLVTIDPVGLTVTEIGPSDDDLDGIAWAGPPPVPVLEIPVLSPISIALLVGLLGIVGFVRLRA